MYVFKCPNCGVNVETAALAPPIACKDCGYDMKRVYSFTTTQMPTGGGTKMPRQTDK